MALIVTVGSADTYFETRLNRKPWDDIDISGNVEKTAALTTAQNQLEVFYDLDSTVELHKTAVYEQALFLLRGGSGIEERDILLAQGVIEAGIVEEKYKGDGGLVICPFAKEALRDSLKSTKGAGAYVVDIIRDDSNYVNRG